MSDSQISVTITPDQLGISERQLAKLTPPMIDSMFKEMAKEAAAIYKTDAEIRNIRRTGAYIGGWRSRKVGVRHYEAASFVKHAVYVEARHRVVADPTNTAKLRQMVRKVAEKYVDEAMKKAYKR